MGTVLKALGRVAGDSKRRRSPRNAREYTVHKTGHERRDGDVGSWHSCVLHLSGHMDHRVVNVLESPGSIAATAKTRRIHVKGGDVLSLWTDGMLS